MTVRDQMVEAAEGAGRGVLPTLRIHRWPCSRVVSTTVAYDTGLPRVERALAMAMYYAQSKAIGKRGSIFSTLIAHLHMARVPTLTLRLWGSREGTAVAHLAVHVGQLNILLEFACERSCLLEVTLSLQPHTNQASMWVNKL